MMRRISLGLFLAGCMVLTAKAQHVPAYLNVELKSPEDQRFMELVQLRADQWVKENDSQVYNMDPFGPISSAERVSLDSLPLEASGTWQISLRHTDAYDILALIGVTKNFHQTIPWPESGIGFTRVIDAPRYVLPLFRYEEFLSPTELARVTAIAEEAIRSIATDHYVVGEHIINSIHWQWNGPDEWKLFTPTIARRHLLYDWCLGEGQDVYSAPDFLYAFSFSETRDLIQLHDTIPVVWEGDTSYVAIDMEKAISGLEFLFQPEPLYRPYPFTDNYRAYSITCNRIGLVLENEKHSTFWMPKEDFVMASHIPQLAGWLDAIFANEVAKRLLTRY